MVNEAQAKKYCRDDISKIENYDKAIADTSQTWHLHHKDEVRTLPSGVTIIRSKNDLIENGRYYGCPANELIFLTKSEHSKLHNANIRPETIQKMSEALKGKKRSDETRQKISEANKGKKRSPFSEEHRQKLSEAKKGKKRSPFSDETRKKMSEALKAYWSQRRKNK